MYTVYIVYIILICQKDIFTTVKLVPIDRTWDRTCIHDSDPIYGDKLTGSKARV